MAYFPIFFYWGGSIINQFLKTQLLVKEQLRVTLGRRKNPHFMDVSIFQLIEVAASAPSYAVRTTLNRSGKVARTTVSASTPRLATVVPQTVHQ